MGLTNVWQLDAPSLRGTHMLLHKHSQFLITGELGNIWLGRMVQVGTMEKVANIAVFCFLLLCRFVERVAYKDSGICCLPNKGIMLLLHNTSTIFILYCTTTPVSLV